MAAIKVVDVSVDAAVAVAVAVLRAARVAVKALPEDATCHHPSTRLRKAPQIKVAKAVARIRSVARTAAGISAVANPVASSPVDPLNAASIIAALKANHLALRAPKSPSFFLANPLQSTAVSLRPRLRPPLF
ncbi:MAG: hypothetical protein NVS9B4_23000 [Candidatus Acidiferrum sp.]